MIDNPGINFKVRCTTHKRFNPETQGFGHNAACPNCKLVHQMFLAATHKRQLDVELESKLRRRFEAWQTVKDRWLTEHVGEEVNAHVTNHEPSTEDLLAQTWETLSPVSKQFELEIEMEYQRLSR